MTNGILHPIRNREELVATLIDIAELEHQFMCMYLYAALSLKKEVKEGDESFSKAQLEATRRWASTIYAIARQEMEHLSLVNSMLAAIGAPPYFARQNTPSQSLHYLSEIHKKRYGLSEGDSLTPIQFPFRFEPFHDRSCQDYACMESPELQQLPGAEREKVEQWCFLNNGDSPDSKLSEIPLHRSRYLSLALKVKRFNPQVFDSLYVSGRPANERKQLLWQLFQTCREHKVQVGTIEEAYKRLAEGFKTVSQKDDSLFVPPYARHQVDILSEYNIYIFPVTDLTSALNAIELIVKQGEGLSKTPDSDTHFLRYFDIAKEYPSVAALSDHPSSFKPALPVPCNPRQEELEEKIKNPLTKHIFHLFNYSYVTLLYVLTGLYGWYHREDNYPYLSATLRELAFAPAMTMLIRSLGEVLVLLPLDSDLNEVAGPTFYIPPGDEARLQIEDSKDWQEANRNQFYSNIEFYLYRFQAIETLLNPGNLLEFPPQFSDRDKLPEELLNDEILAVLIKDGHLIQLPDIGNESIKTRLHYIWENIYRMTANLRETYQTGVYWKFKTTP